MNAPNGNGFILGIIIVAGVFLFMVHSCEDQAQQTEVSQQEQTDEQKQQAEEAAKDKADKEAQSLEDAKTDKANSARWNITVEQARTARESLDDAYASCVVELKNSAKYDYKSDWMPNYSWFSDGPGIIIHGRDVHLQNSFGAYAGGYICKYNIAKKEVLNVIVDTEE